MVMPPLEQTALMTLEEYIQRYETLGPFEIINGEEIHLSPVVAGHSDSARIIYRAMIVADPDNQHGIAWFESAFVLVEQVRWVKGSRVPDILYFEINRFEAYKIANPDWRSKPFVLVPDLVVEIISETDLYSEVDTKVESYLNDGVGVIWLVDSKQQSVAIRGRGIYQKLTLADTLTGGELIPGFALPVRAIFA
jgi:Uma2 family endonuclease